MCSCTNASSIFISTGKSKMATLQEAVKGLVVLRSCLLLVAILAWTWSSASSTEISCRDLSQTLECDDSDETATISKMATIFGFDALTCCHLAREFPFADKLRNDPCSVLKKTTGKEGAAEFITETKLVNDHLVKSLEKLQNLVKDTLREDVPVSCKDILWYPLAKYPTVREIQVYGAKRTLYQFHSSLLNHTAYLHHMYYQVHKYDRSCNRGEIVLSARRLILDIKKVTCNLRRYLLAVYDKDFDDESFIKPLEESLDVSLCGQCVCDRRALYDCRVVLSLNSVLNQFAYFMQQLGPAVVLLGSADNLPVGGSSDSHSLSESRESATLSTKESITPHCESMDLLTQPDVTTIESTETTEECRRIPCPLAKTFKFVDKIRDDPCKILLSDRVGKRFLTSEEPAVVTIYNILREYIELFKRRTVNTKKNDLLIDCEEYKAEYKSGSVAKMLKLNKHQLHNPGEILFLYYSALTNITAHLYNMHHLLHKYDTTCSRGIIQASARTLAFDIRKLTCFLRLYILAAYPEKYNEDSFDKPSMDVVEEPLCDEYYCPRRAIYDCLVVTTLNDVLGELGFFIQRILPEESSQELNPIVRPWFNRIFNITESGPDHDKMGPDPEVDQAHLLYED